MKPLSRLQAECLKFLKAYSHIYGIAPSFKEMEQHLRVHSKSVVSKTLAVLEADGYIRRLPKRARAIELLPPPGQHEQSCRCLACNQAQNEKFLELTRALASEAPVFFSCVQSSNLRPLSTVSRNRFFGKPNPPAPRTRKGNSLGGELTGMTAAAEGSGVCVVRS